MNADSSYTFSNLQALTAIDFGGDLVSASEATNLFNLFYSCGALGTESLAQTEAWDVSKVSDMSGMFRGCSLLTGLDLSGWDTSNVTDLSSMFQRCYALKELTVTGWTVRYGTKTTFLFNSCSVLERIYTDQDWNISGTSTYIFYNCNSLTGGEGTGWTKSNESNANYAKIDREGRKGFFTDIANKP